MCMHERVYMYNTCVVDLYVLHETEAHAICICTIIHHTHNTHVYTYRLTVTCTCTCVCQLAGVDALTQHSQAV